MNLSMNPLKYKKYFQMQSKEIFLKFCIFFSKKNIPQQQTSLLIGFDMFKVRRIRLIATGIILFRKYKVNKKRSTKNRRPLKKIIDFYPMKHFLLRKTSINVSFFFRNKYKNYGVTSQILIHLRSEAIGSAAFGTNSCPTKPL